MYAVLYLPSFRLQAALRQRPQDDRADSPVALVDAAEKKSVVLEVNAAARRAGVHSGLPVPRAMARCAELTVLPRTLPGERTVQTVLLQTAGGLSPEIESTAPGLCTLHLRLSPGADAQPALQKAMAALTALDLRPQAALAPNPELAAMAARRARPLLVVGEPNAFLDALPVRVLRPPAELLTLLHSWGIHTLRQLRSLPRAGLTDRLGPDAGRLWELAAGETQRPLNLIEPPVEFVESMAFEHEVDTLEPLLFLLRRFLQHLTQRLRSIWRVAGAMQLSLAMGLHPACERFFSIPAPCADPEVLFRILHTHLESLRLEHRLTGLTLRLEPAAVTRDQLQLFETALRDPNRLGETLARLAALTGPENTGVCVRHDTHLPDTWRLEMPQFHRLSSHHAAGAVPARMTGLPLRRFRPPLPAAVSISGHVPGSLDSSLTGGIIADAAGPYRLSGGWWEQGAWAREEWDVALADGTLLRLACTGAEWVVEGIYDMAEAAPAADGAGFPSAPVIAHPLAAAGPSSA